MVMELVDIQGQILWQTEVEHQVNNFEVKVFQNLTKGVYFIKLNNGQFISTKKIVHL